MVMVGEGTTTTKTTTTYGRFLDPVMVGAGRGDRRMTTHGRFLDPVMVKGKVVVGRARSEEEKWLMCTASIYLVRSGRNPGGSRLKIGDRPKRVHAWLKLVFVVSRSQLRRVFFSCGDVVAPFVGFLSPLQKGCDSCSFASTIVCFLSSNLKLPFLHQRFQVRVLYTSVVALRCDKNFFLFHFGPQYHHHRSNERLTTRYFIRHTNRELLRFVYPPASEVIQVFNVVEDICLSFLRNRSGCNGIRTGVEEDSSDGSRVGGSCWGYRSAGPGCAPSNDFAKRCSTGVASRVFGGTSGRQRRCILRLLRLIISRAFLPRDLIDSWDIYISL